jgi:hypothetical protein
MTTHTDVLPVYRSTRASNVFSHSWRNMGFPARANYPDLGQLAAIFVFRPPMEISIQNAGPTCEFWTNPVNFRFRESAGYEA